MMMIARLGSAATAALLVLARICGDAAERETPRVASSAAAVIREAAAQPSRSVAVTFDGPEVPGWVQALARRQPSPNARPEGAAR